MTSQEPLGEMARRRAGVPAHKWQPVMPALAVLTLMVSACSYHGALRTDFYDPPAEIADKIPLTVEVGQAYACRPITALGGLGDSYRIEVRRGVQAALQRGLATVFERVTMTEMSASESEADLHVEPTFDWTLVHLQG